MNDRTHGNPRAAHQSRYLDRYDFAPIGYLMLTGDTGWRNLESRPRWFRHDRQHWAKEGEARSERATA
jgi:hypothetical protein